MLSKNLADQVSILLSWIKLGWTLPSAGHSKKLHSMVHYGPLGFLYNANIVEQGFAIGIFISHKHCSARICYFHRIWCWTALTKMVPSKYQGPDQELMLNTTVSGPTGSFTSLLWAVYTPLNQELLTQVTHTKRVVLQKYLSLWKRVRCLAPSSIPIKNS